MLFKAFTYHLCGHFCFQVLVVLDLLDRNFQPCLIVSFLGVTLCLYRSYSLADLELLLLILILDLHFHELYLSVLFVQLIRYFGDLVLCG